jgi:hypothetical protein
VGSCDHSDRPLDFTKRQGISLTAKPSHVGVCSMHLVTLVTSTHKTTTTTTTTTTTSSSSSTRDDSFKRHEYLTPRLNSVEVL